MKVPHGNWFESPWQDIRSGIRQVTLDTKLEHLCCTVGRVENGNEINPHSHENEQIAIVLEGECDYYVDGSMYHMTPGSWIAIPPRSVHYTHVYNSAIPCLQLSIYYPNREEYQESYRQFCQRLSQNEEKSARDAGNSR